ncbi:MAG: hypothetical protein OXK76_08295 [Gammaproteobacteria bacterium]|nr:hypothetical protein [Gammaproteobacteria bacterium]
MSDKAFGDLPQGRRPPPRARRWSILASASAEPLNGPREALSAAG